MTNRLSSCDHGRSLDNLARQRQLRAKLIWVALVRLSPTVDLAAMTVPPTFETVSPGRMALVLADSLYPWESDILVNWFDAHLA